MNLNTTPRPAASTGTVETTANAIAALPALRSKVHDAAHRTVVITLPVVLPVAVDATLAVPLGNLPVEAAITLTVVVTMLGEDLRRDHNHTHRALAPAQIAPSANFTY